MSLTEAAYRRRKWEHFTVLQSVLENQDLSKAYRTWSSAHMSGQEYISDLMSIYELLDIYLTENNGAFSDDHLHVKELLIKDLRVLSEMLSEVADKFSNAAHIAEQLSKS
jgi:hypothetical protein